MFDFEREQHKTADAFYLSKGWWWKRIKGIENIKFDAVINPTREFGKWIRCEEKFRFRDYGDFLVEIIQDTESKDLGWLYTSQAQYIFYFPPEKVYCINLKKLKELDLSNFPDKYSYKGWGTSHNKVVPWDIMFKLGIAKQLK